MKYKRTFGNKKIVAALIIAVLGLSCFQNAQASALSNAQNKKDQAQEDLNNANAAIQAIEDRQAELQGQIDEANADLFDTLVNLGIVEQELADNQAELEKVTADLAEAEEDEQEQYDAMVKRIVYMYENGDDNFVEAVVGAKDFSDMLNRIEYAQEMYDYDRNLLTEYQETKQAVADLKLSVEQTQAELEEIQHSYQEEKANYESIIAAKQEEMDEADFNTQLANAKALASQYQQTIDEQNAIIKAEQERPKPPTGSTGGGNGGGSGNDANIPSDGGNLNPPFVTGVSGDEVVNFACQFIGNPYVWGGTDLINGADCSGYVQSVYANFGITLPRTSYEQRSAGQEVSYANAQPGDIICYAGHVAIYTGNGGIVHASAPGVGIIRGTATYRPILSVRRVL